MKKHISIFLFYLVFSTVSFAQNVGIGTTSPQAKLDINGDIAFRSANITITTTYNYALDVNTVKQSNYKLLGSVLPPLGNFIIAGITASADGRTINLANRSGFSMELYNEYATSLAADRIITGTGTTFAVYNGGTVSLRYDASGQRWEIISSHYNSLDYFGGGGGSSYWDLSGNDIKNNNPGNVGIGTSSPTFKLDVNGTFRSKGSSITGNGANGGSLNVWSNDLPGTQYQYLNMDGQKIQSMGSPNIGTAPSAKDLFINPFGGRVGIGTDVPTFRLDVNGNVRSKGNGITGNGVNGGALSIWTNDLPGTQYQYLNVDGQNIQSMGAPNFATVASPKALTLNPFGGNVEIGTVAYPSLLSFPNTTGKKITLWNNGANDYGIGLQLGEMQLYTAGQDMISFGYGSSNSYNRTMVYYTGTAQLGINCLPQTGYTLAVKGHVRSTEIVVESGWADYVFDKSYKLKPLDEVEAFIKSNNHLPNIPSATEIQKDGLKVGELQTKMMEKIEELTLYIIQLKKEVEALKTK